MHPRFFIIFLLFSSSAFANFMEASSESKEERVIDKKWAMNLGADYRKVETGFPVFEGIHSDIEDNDAVEVWGVDLGLSRVLLNIGYFEIEAKIGTVYAKTVQSKKGLASKEYDDIDLANERVDYQLLSGRGSLVMGYTFEGKLVNIKPFVEVASGVGASTIEKEYTFEGIETNKSDAESYDYKVTEDFIFTEVALGISFIGKAGLLSYLRASQVASNTSEREITGESIRAGTPTPGDETKKDVSSSYTTFALGIGYAF